MKISAIITAAGNGSRCNLNYNKLLYRFQNMHLIEKTVSAFIRKDIDNIIITSSKEDMDKFNEIFKNYHSSIKIIEGGKTRQESVFKALNYLLDFSVDYVLIHDGARPFVSSKLIDDAIEISKEKSNAVAAIECTDSLRLLDLENKTSSPVDRSYYMRVQTPQAFYFKTIYKYHKLANDKNLSFSDDASILDYFNEEVHIFKGSEENIKITTPADLQRLTLNNSYCGVGWDTHELVENRKLILGGVEIDHYKGLLGHSDADVLIHAIMDAILSAAHLKDIGQLFPDTSLDYKDISSLILLKKVAKLIDEKNLKIGNISACIMAQKPKLANYIPKMQQTLADCLNIDEQQITISATTTEKLGLCGKEEAISANAYCLLNVK